jgi:glucose/arabinose dehydrogenase
MAFLRKFLVLIGVLVLLAAGFIAWSAFSQKSDRPITDSMGTAPTLVEPDSQTFPSVSLPKPAGWGDGEKPAAAKGLVVTRFAERLDHPRTMLALPNGDILVAETNSPPREMSGIGGWVMKTFMSRVGAFGPSLSTRASSTSRTMTPCWLSPSSRVRPV